MRWVVRSWGLGRPDYSVKELHFYDAVLYVCCKGVRRILMLEEPGASLAVSRSRVILRYFQGL